MGILSKLWSQRWWPQWRVCNCEKAGVRGVQGEQCWDSSQRLGNILQELKKIKGLKIYWKGRNGQENDWELRISSSGWFLALQNWFISVVCYITVKQTTWVLQKPSHIVEKKGVRFCFDFSLVFPLFHWDCRECKWDENFTSWLLLQRKSRVHPSLPQSRVCMCKSGYGITKIIQISLHGNHGYLLTFLVVVTTLSQDICHRAKFGPQLSM